MTEPGELRPPPTSPVRRRRPIMTRPPRREGRQPSPQCPIVPASEEAGEVKILKPGGKFEYLVVDGEFEATKSLKDEKILVSGGKLRTKGNRGKVKISVQDGELMHSTQNGGRIEVGDRGTAEIQTVQSGVIRVEDQGSVGVDCLKIGKVIIDGPQAVAHIRQIDKEFNLHNGSLEVGGLGAVFIEAVEERVPRQAVRIGEDASLFVINRETLGKLNLTVAEQKAAFVIKDNAISRKEWGWVINKGTDRERRIEIVRMKNESGQTAYAAFETKEDSAKRTTRTFLLGRRADNLEEFDAALGKKLNLPPPTRSIPEDPPSPPRAPQGPEQSARPRRRRRRPQPAARPPAPGEPQRASRRTEKPPATGLPAEIKKELERLGIKTVEELIERYKVKDAALRNATQRNINLEKENVELREELDEKGEAIEKLGERLDEIERRQKQEASVKGEKEEEEPEAPSEKKGRKKKKKKKEDEETTVEEKPKKKKRRKKLPVDHEN